MRAGNLNRRIAILAIGASVDDGLRVLPGGWEEIGKRWAELTPLSGAERVVAAEKEAVETLKFRVRRDALTSAIAPGTHRIGYGARTYEVQDKQEVALAGFDLVVSGRSDGGAA